MKLADWLERHPEPPLTVPRDVPFETVVRLVTSEHRLRDLYVTDASGRLVGRIPHTKVVRMLLGSHRPSHTRRELFDRVAGGTAEHLMTPRFVVAHGDERIDEVAARMLDHGVDDLPVVDPAGKPRGMVYLADLARAVAAEEV